MGMLKMTFFQFDVKLVKILYSAFIRPLIEFAVHKCRYKTFGKSSTSNDKISSVLEKIRL